MSVEIRGEPQGTGRAFALVASQFNAVIVDRLVAGARDALVQQGVDPGAITVFWVPGAFELPLVCRRIAKKGGFDAILALGCVIRGETDHYEHVAGQCAAGLARVSLEQDVPVMFGVLTCDTLEQALNRAGGKSGNHGAHCALAALELIALLDQI